MANFVSGISPLGLGAERMRAAFKTPVARDSGAFNQQLVQELTRSLKRMGLAEAGVHVTVQPAETRGADAKPPARQILVNYRTPASQPPSQPASTPASPPPAASPVDVLRAALANAGLDPDAYNLSESREVVHYPGGSYVNHMVTAQFASGYTESYDVALMLRDPKVTVVEMRRAAGYRS